MENESDKMVRKRLTIQVTRNENGEQEGQGSHMVRHCGAFFVVHVLLTAQGKDEHSSI